ncbi:MAG: radical SAM protein [Anaerolineae bacterium]|nr:radical SAM protein [Anaerolineae bacterium]
MINDIQARTLLTTIKEPDSWFGLKYNLNLYRGCQHQCIYCDSRSECYRIENFNEDVLVKTNAIDLLRVELPRKRVKGTIGFGAMNDPYMPLEAERCLTRQALEIVADCQFPVHIITKSDLVVRDLDLLSRINRVYAAVSITVTTANDELAKKLEPGAPSPSRRFAAMRRLRDAGIVSGVTLMPVLPFIEDDDAALEALVAHAAASGALYILAAFGVTLRDRQRTWFYRQLDRLFPDLRRRYEETFGERYSCQSPRSRHLDDLLSRLCVHYGIQRRMPFYTPPAETLIQPRLF